MREIGQKTFLMARVNLQVQMGSSIRANLRWVNVTDMEFKLCQMDQDSKASGTKII